MGSKEFTKSSHEKLTIIPLIGQPGGNLQNLLAKKLRFLPSLVSKGYIHHKTVLCSFLFFVCQYEIHEKTITENLQ